MASPTSLAPGFARVTYSGVRFPHHMTIPVKYSGTPVPGTEPTLANKGGSTTAGLAAMLTFFTTLQPLFKTTVKFGLVEFHTIDPTTGLDTFIWAGDINLAGTDTGTQQAMEQSVFTFKTVGGTLYRLYLMETNENPNLKIYPPFTSAIDNDIVDYVTGAASVIYGRGNFFPFAVISKVTKTNDKLRKQAGLA